MLAYQPVWNGDLLWDDAVNMTTPELRSLDGLRRVWFEPTDNPAILSSSLYLVLAPAKDIGRFDHRISFAQSSVAHWLCSPGPEDPAFSTNPGSRVGDDHLCAAPSECGISRLDF